MKAHYLIFAGLFLSFNSQAQNIVNEPKGNYVVTGRMHPVYN